VEPTEGEERRGNEGMGRREVEEREVKGGKLSVGLSFYKSHRVLGYKTLP